MSTLIHHGQKLFCLLQRDTGHIIKKMNSTRSSGQTLHFSTMHDASLYVS